MRLTTRTSPLSSPSSPSAVSVVSDSRSSSSTSSSSTSSPSTTTFLGAASLLPVAVAIAAGFFAAFIASSSAFVGNRRGPLFSAVAPDAFAALRASSSALVRNRFGAAAFLATFFAFGFAAGLAMVRIGTNFDVADFAGALFFLLDLLLLAFAAATFFFGCFLGARATGKMSPLVFSPSD